MIPEEKDIYSIVFNQNLANTFFSLFLQIFYLIQFLKICLAICLKHSQASILLVGRWAFICKCIMSMFKLLLWLSSLCLNAET